MRRFPHAIAAVATVAIACGSFGEDGETPSAGIDAGSDAGADAAPATGDADTVADGGLDGATTCPQGSLLCDDFQSASVALWQVTGTTNYGGGTIAAGVEDGNYFLRSHQPARAEMTNGALGSRQLANAIIPGTLAVRARVRIPANPPANAHILQLHAPGSPDDLFNHSLVVGAKKWVIETYTLENAYSLFEAPAANEPALGSWVCVEMDIGFAPDTPNAIQLFVNDVLLVNASGLTLDAFEQKFPSVIEVRAGLLTSEAVSADVDFDIDDVVVQTSNDLTAAVVPRIGCPKN